MSRFTSCSIRRLVAALALATTAVVPSLALIAGQTPASSVAATVSPKSIKMH